MGVESYPNMVQAENVTLQFFGSPEQTVRYNNGRAFVRLTAPPEVGVYKTGVECYDMFLKEPCRVTVDRNAFTVYPSETLLAGKQFQYRLTNAINNPDSEMPTTSFKIETSEGEQATNGITLDITRGGMKKFLLSPRS